MDQKRISIQMNELVRKMGPDNFSERYAFIFAQCLKITQKVSFYKIVKYVPFQSIGFFAPKINITSLTFLPQQKSKPSHFIFKHTYLNSCAKIARYVFLNIYFL